MSTINEFKLINNDTGTMVELPVGASAINIDYKGNNLQSTVEQIELDIASLSASTLSYNPSQSGIDADNVQDAIDKVADSISLDNLNDVTLTSVLVGDTIIYDGNGWINDQIEIPSSLSELSDDTNHRLVTDVEKTTWNNKLDEEDLDQIELDISALQGSVLGITSRVEEIENDYIKSTDLATVATSGEYDDLLNKPTIPAAQVNSDWNASSGVAKILNKPSLATVATSGSYNDLSNKPTIPTVNNATLTIQRNGSTVKTFTANASSNVTCNIEVPTNTNQLTNGAGFITSSGSCNYATTAGTPWVTNGNWRYYKDSVGIYHMYYSNTQNLTFNFSQSFGSLYMVPGTWDLYYPVALSVMYYVNAYVKDPHNLVSTTVAGIHSDHSSFYIYGAKQQQDAGCNFFVEILAR